MDQYSRGGRAFSTAIGGNRSHYGAMDCTAIPAICARAIWPRKTAENWAAAAGVKPRMAKYWLAGHEVSGNGRLAIIRLLI